MPVPQTQPATVKALQALCADYTEGCLLYTELRSEAAVLLGLSVGELTVRVGGEPATPVIPHIPLTPAQIQKRAKEERDAHRAALRDALIVKFNTFLIKELGGLAHVSIELDRRDGFTIELVDEVLHLFISKGWRIEVEQRDSKRRVKFTEPVG